MTLRILATLLALSLLAVPAAASTGTTLERIERAHLSGEIDHEEYVLYRLYRVADKSLIPPDLVAPTEQERPLRCGTPMVRAARAAVDWMSPEARLGVDLVLPRNPQNTLDYTSDNFSLIVGPDFTGTEEDIDWWLETFETAWTVEVDELGFSNPPCTNAYLFEVKLANTGGFTPPLSHDTWGYTDHSGDCPYVVMHPDYEFTGNPIGAAQVTAAHEFHHGIQSGYDWWEGNYWMEATATWAEDLVFDDVDDYIDYLNGSEGWLIYPELALTYEDGFHEYGNVIWVKYLAENYGGDAVIVEVWNRAMSVDAIEAAAGMMEAQGSSLDEGFVDFTVKLVTRDFEEGELYDDVYWMADHETYPASGAPDRYLPRELGSNYVSFRPSGDPQDLRVEFAGSPDDDGSPVTWGLGLVSVTGDAYTYEILQADEGGLAGGWVHDLGGAVDQAFLTISVLSGDSNTTPGVAYSYEATLGEAPEGDDDDDDDDDASPADDDDDGDGDDQGCGCRADGGAAASTWMGLALLLIAAFVRRSRREP